MKRFLDSLPLLEQHQAARLLALCPKVELQPGEALDPSAFVEATFLVVEQGVVALGAAPRSGRRMILGFSTAGAVLPPPHGDEQLSGLTESTLVSVTPPVSRTLLQRPPIAEAVVAGLIEAIRERQENLGQFANVAHVDRLRAKLLQLARLHGTSVDGGISIELPLTHELLGQTIGSARETVTTSLKALEHEGFLARDGRSYRLVLAAPLEV
jgi:CRP-like cAMP-binding protein